MRFPVESNLTCCSRQNTRDSILKASAAILLHIAVNSISGIPFLATQACQLALSLHTKTMVSG